MSLENFYFSYEQTFFCVYLDLILNNLKAYINSLGFKHSKELLHAESH